MEYSQLPATYKYDTLAEAIYSRQLEHFHYNLDLVNFNYLIANTPVGAYRQELQGRINSTIEQMQKVSGVYDGLLAQVDNQVEYDAAVVRAMQRRVAAAA